ncbi:MAG: serine hydrolase [Frankiales bacterium]|nr:MAG: serine hydrolase [Frankiales bacterium]
MTRPAPDATTDVTAALTDVFSRAGAVGRLHAREIGTGHEVGLGADEPVVLASTFKVPVALEVFAQAAEGGLDLSERVRVPVEGRAPGPTGLSVFSHEAELSLHDLARSMITVSDNAATDVVCERVGLDRVAARLGALGLDEIVIPYDCRGIFATVFEDAARAGLPTDAFPSDPEVLRGVRALDPLQTDRGTPRAMTRLLELIWTDTAGPADACAQVREVMAQQVWPHRLTAGFPADVTLAGKTGTLPSQHNEVGVVGYPDGRSYAVAVYVRSARFDLRQPLLDRAIGEAARIAVDALRG